MIGARRGKRDDGGISLGDRGDGVIATHDCGGVSFEVVPELSYLLSPGLDCDVTLVKLAPNDRKAHHDLGGRTVVGVSSIAEQDPGTRRMSGCTGKCGVGRAKGRD